MWNWCENDAQTLAYFCDESLHSIVNVFHTRKEKIDFSTVKKWYHFLKRQTKFVWHRHDLMNGECDALPSIKCDEPEAVFEVPNLVNRVIHMVQIFEAVSMCQKHVLNFYLFCHMKTVVQHFSLRLL